MLCVCAMRGNGRESQWMKEGTLHKAPNDMGLHLSLSRRRPLNDPCPMPPIRSIHSLPVSLSLLLVTWHSENPQPPLYHHYNPRTRARLLVSLNSTHTS